MLRIRIDTISHQNQRYPTCGDFQTIGNESQIRVSKLDNQDYETLIGLHEFVEMILCKKAGISDDVIDAFDLEFDKSGQEGEPGDSPNAPYHLQHTFATLIEKLVAKELGVDWDAYEAAITKLFEVTPDAMLVQPNISA